MERPILKENYWRQFDQTPLKRLNIEMDCLRVPTQQFQNIVVFEELMMILVFTVENHYFRIAGGGGGHSVVCIEVKPNEV